MVRAISRLDLILTFTIFLLLALGFTILSSVAPSLLQIQLLASVIGLILYITISQIPSSLWFQFNKPLYLICLILLALPIVFGTAAGGAVRWLQLGAISIQPSEIVRPFLIVILAGILGRAGPLMWSTLVKSGLVILLPIVMIYLQPDLDMAIILTIGWLAMIVTKGITKKQLIVGLLLTVAAIPVGWSLMHDYQKNRVLTFLNPGSDPLDTGYHVLQSQIAVGSGQILGRGLGRGTQSHLRFLPERHTDFIFASLAEELGMVGAGLVLVLYFILFSRLVKAIDTARNEQTRLIASGLLATLFIQIFINISMNVGILPVTGITLPLLSYGGSSIISTFITLGFVNNLLFNLPNAQSLRIH